MMSKIVFVFLLSLSATFASCTDPPVECPNIISRSQWTNVPAGDVNYLIMPIPYVVIHHTVTPECETREKCSQRVDNIRGYHMDDNGWDDIGYSFLVGGDGNIYEGVGWTREGAHTYSYNKKSIGISFIGNFSRKQAKQSMLDAVHQLIECGKSQGILRSNVRVIGGRQVGPTSSPGEKLYQQIQNWPEWVSNP
ncbi:PREDICTED: peptidoglycan-recognition protein 2-like isoform X1 [Dinoponera quadriceps]|uniref:Peptidoglycan-recognition protein n=1 Tax=Dinoponera quadriceps TaxID=609295 RepID=A0A6P3XRA7_DINQU|nr:PREDICTED: peptidoglycan-recognition protein 2-like isoform X1 [Dinoponera quadriceps]